MKPNSCGSKKEFTNSAASLCTCGVERAQHDVAGQFAIFGLGSMQ